MNSKTLGFALLATSLLAAAASGSANPPAGSHLGGATVTGNFPAYGWGQSEPAAWTKQEAKELRDDVREMRAELREIKKLLAGGKPTAKQAGDDPVALYRTYCAACHTPATAESGGGFELFRDDEGKTLRRFKAEEKQIILNRINRGTMPPKKSPQPTPDEKARFE